jgi:hypothetical protein
MIEVSRRGGESRALPVVWVWEATAVGRKPFPLLDVVPAALHGLVLDFEWDRERLWQLVLPVETVPVGSLRWLLRLPLWSFGGEPFQVTPEGVQADPGRYHLHYARALAADLSFPLHVLACDGETLTVLDGTHRLFKADLLGERTVAVKKVPIAWLDCIAKWT